MILKSTISVQIKACTTLLLITLIQVLNAQNPFSFNEGGANQREYFTSIPYENINGKIILKVKIKEKTYRFILDTGAPTSISTELYNELNLPLLTKIPISDANNKLDSLSVVQLSNISIGEIEFSMIPTLVINKNLIFECFKIDGFIGSNLLRNSIIQINNQDKSLIITNDSKKLNLNSRFASDMILDRQSSPIISIYLKNEKKAKEDLLLDLGLNSLYEISMNNFRLFSKSGIFTQIVSSTGSNSMGLFGLAEDTEQYRFILPELAISNVKLIRVSGETILDDNSRIGSKILDFGITTIDYKNKKFYLIPFKEDRINASELKFPVDFLPRNNKLFVGFVWDEKLKASISNGDQIIAIDDINVENLNICDFITEKSILKGKQAIKLTTKNKKDELKITFIEKI